MIAYGFINYGKGLCGYSADLLLLFFLTDVAGLPPAVAGLLIAISLVIDAVADPLVGYAIDRHWHHVFSYSGIITRAAPVVTSAFVFIFIFPTTSMAVGIIYAVTVLLLYRIAYTFIDIPHNSMLASLTRSSKERSTLSGVRLALSSSAYLTAVVSAHFFVFAPSVSTNRAEFLQFSIGIALLALITLLLSARTTGRFERGTPTDRPSSIPLRQLLQQLIAHKPLIFAFAASAAIYVFQPLFAKSLIYYAKYSVGDDALAGRLLNTMILLQVLSAPIWIVVTHRLGRVRAAIFAHSILIICMVIMWTQFDAIGPIQYLLIAGIGFAFGGIYLTIWAIIPDAIDAGRHEAGTNLRASLFGTFTFVNKVSNGLGVLALGTMLSLAGFEANAPASAELGTVIEVSMVGFPIVGALLCIVMLIRYSLST